MSQLLTVADYKESARRKMKGPSFAYYVGGSEDEHTLRLNSEAFSRLIFLPRVSIHMLCIKYRLQITGDGWCKLHRHENQFTWEATSLSALNCSYSHAPFSTPQSNQIIIISLIVAIQGEADMGRAAILNGASQQYFFLFYSKSFNALLFVNICTFCCIL